MMRAFSLYLDGTNILMSPSPETIGTMIFTAPLSRFTPFQILAGVGRGTISLPTPKSATEKKCVTSVSGFVSKPPSNAMGPADMLPPRRRYSKHALGISSMLLSVLEQNTL